MSDHSEVSSSLQPSRGKTGLQLADGIGIALLSVVFLVISYIRSHNHIFWTDEIFGVLTLRQPSWPALIHAWRSGLDSSGIWFYVFARPWIAIFGASEVSLREFSTVGVAASAAVIWIAARRYYSILPVAATVSFVYGTMPALRWQLANGRTYGIFMLSIALIIYLILRGEDEDQAKPTWLFLLATFGAYSLLAGSHIIASAYIGSLLATQIVLDLVRRRFRPLLYLSAACSFVFVLFSLANIKAIAANGKPSFWTVKPTLHDLLTSYTAFGGYRVSLILFCLLLVALLHLTIVRARTPVYVILLGFAGIDLLLYAYSRVATSVYVDRYLLPMAFAGILLLCELLTQIASVKAQHRWLAVSLPALVLLLAASALANTKIPADLPYPDYTARLLAALPPGLPVVDADNASVIEMHFYHPDGTRPPFLYPVDWQTALDPSIQGGVSGYHEMDNFKAIGWYAQDILPYQEAISRYPNFVVLATPGNSLWLHRRILNDPRFQATLYKHFEKGHTERFGTDDLDIWVVHTR